MFYVNIIKVNIKVNLNVYTFQTFPIVYAIMEGRTTQNYIDVLNKIVNVIKIEPATAISDFEKAERKALQTIFPSAKIIGCFFHYSQVIKKNYNYKHKMHVILIMLVSLCRR